MLKLQLIIFPLLVHAGSAESFVPTRPLVSAKIPVDDFSTTYEKHASYVTEVCPTAFNITGNCATGVVPHALSLSGGACLALLMQVGLFRSAALNPFTDYFVYGGSINEPTTVSTSSGGSLFYSRYTVLRDYPIPNKFAYPCYLLDARYREVCYHNSALGQIADICDSEYWMILSTFIGTTYAECNEAAGGQGSVFKQFTLLYFTFLNTVPSSTGEKRYIGLFWDRFLKTNVFYGTPQTWIIGIDLVAPVLVNPAAPWNYGYQSHAPNGYSSFAPIFEGTTMTGYKVGQDWSWNISLATAVLQSSSINSAAQVLPFSIGPNNFGQTVKVDSALKVQAIVISYVMMHRLMAKDRVPDGSFWPGCQDGCPAVDTAAIDNVPLTTNLAWVSKLPTHMRPANYFVQGPAATFELFRFLMGLGHMEIWLAGGSGANSCPFPELTVCSALTNIRKMLKNLASTPVLRQYEQTSNAYQVWLPQNAIMTSWCGDPIAYDQFHAKCTADSFCTMPLLAIPSSKTQISFTAEQMAFMLSNVYLGNTGLASDFVENFIPASTRAIPNMRDMDKWFPAFTAMGSEKGGFGFYRALGHAFMDFCTHVLQRDGMYIVSGKTVGEYMYTGVISQYQVCEYKIYEDIAALNEKSFITFRAALGGDTKFNMMDGTLGGIPSAEWIDEATPPNDNLITGMPPKGFDPPGSQ